MSNSNQAKSTQPAQQGPSLRDEVTELRSAFETLAMMLLPHNLRNHCACGRIACGSVQLTTPGVFDVKTMYLCDECSPPAGAQRVGSVDLGPAERETVRLANKLGRFRVAPTG